MAKVRWASSSFKGEGSSKKCTAMARNRAGKGASSRKMAGCVRGWHFAEWSGEVRNIVYSSDGKISICCVSCDYGTDAEVPFFAWEFESGLALTDLACSVFECITSL